jgi:hypothetical protein
MVRDFKGILGGVQGNRTPDSYWVRTPSTPYGHVADAFQTVIRLAILGQGYLHDGCVIKHTHESFLLCFVTADVSGIGTAKQMSQNDPKLFQSIFNVLHQTSPFVVGTMT